MPLELYQQAMAAAQQALSFGSANIEEDVKRSQGQALWRTLMVNNLSNNVREQWEKKQIKIEPWELPNLIIQAVLGRAYQAGDCNALSALTALYLLNHNQNVNVMLTTLPLTKGNGSRPPLNHTLLMIEETDGSYVVIDVWNKYCGQQESAAVLHKTITSLVYQCAEKNHVSAFIDTNAEVNIKRLPLHPKHLLAHDSALRTMLDMLVTSCSNDTIKKIFKITVNTILQRAPGRKVLCDRTFIQQIADIQAAVKNFRQERVQHRVQHRVLHPFQHQFQIFPYREPINSSALFSQSHQESHLLEKTKENVDKSSTNPISKLAIQS